MQGRLDLVIRFGELGILVVEVKVGKAEGADTAKQDGYQKWLNQQKGEHYQVLLARDGDKEEYEGGFRLLKWADLCIGLRHVAKDALSKRETVRAAMILAFVGAVERNLLGLSIAAIDQFEHGHLATFDPRVVDHVQRWTSLEVMNNAT